MALVQAWPDPPDAGNTAAGPVPGSTLRGRVLVAEDDPNIRQLIALLLRGTGIELAMVDNGRLAVEQALAGDYDLLLTDLQMPEMGGLEAADWLRKAGFRRPIIILSADAGNELKERCLAAGCNDYLAKPFEARRLLALLARHLPGDTAAAAPADDGAGRLEDDPEYQRARAAFLDMMRQAPTDMAAGAAQGDWESLRRLAHRIKGTAGAFGFAEVGIAAGRIEDHLKNGRVEEVAAALEMFHNAVSRAREGSTDGLG